MTHPRHWRSWLRSRRYEFWMNVGARELRQRAFDQDAPLSLHIRLLWVRQWVGR